MLRQPSRQIIPREEKKTESRECHHDDGLMKRLHENVIFLIGNITKEKMVARKMGGEVMWMVFGFVKLLKEKIDHFATRTNRPENPGHQRANPQVVKREHRGNREHVVDAKNEEVLPNKCPKPKSPAINELELFAALSRFEVSHAKQTKVQHSQ